MRLQRRPAKRKRNAKKQKPKVARRKPTAFKTPFDDDDTDDDDDDDDDSDSDDYGDGYNYDDDNHDDNDDDVDVVTPSTRDTSIDYGSSGDELRPTRSPLQSSPMVRHASVIVCV
jgi:hypothetical protein